MSTQKQKFELISRLRDMGFTFEEAVALRRIEMTLIRWAEAECNGEIERDEGTDKPRRNSAAWINGHARERVAWPIADREAGALRRLKAIVDACNEREAAKVHGQPYDAIRFYHQGDPRGCALYLVRVSAIPDGGELGQYYTRGLAVCA